MQSPPASADATRVIILSPGFARPGASPSVIVEFTQPQVLGEGHRNDQPGIGHQAVKGDLDAVRMVKW